MTVEELGKSAFLHVSVLEKSGITNVLDGDVLIVDVARSQKGIAVSHARKAQTDEVRAAKMVDVVVEKLFRDRGYGFVYVPSLSQHAFFHISILTEQDRHTISIGKALRAEINVDPKGRGFQVRRVA